MIDKKRKEKRREHRGEIVTTLSKRREMDDIVNVSTSLVKDSKRVVLFET